jgi:hypothetical protein
LRHSIVTESVGASGRKHLPLLIATIEAAIARGCRHYSESGELLATTLAVLDPLRRRPRDAPADAATDALVAESQGCHRGSAAGPRCMARTSIAACPTCTTAAVVEAPHRTMTSSSSISVFVEERPQCRD